VHALAAPTPPLPPVVPKAIRGPAEAVQQMGGRQRAREKVTAGEGTGPCLPSGARGE